MTDHRTLITQLCDELDHCHRMLLDDCQVTHPLADRARAALVADGPAVPEGREPASVTGQPSHSEIRLLYCQTFGLRCDPDSIGPAPVKFARVVLARWGNPAPQSPAKGEVAYLVRELRDQADDMSPSLELFGLIHRAADLLERRHLAPVPVLPEGTQVIEPTERTILVPVPVPMPVSERLPGLEECDGEGRCWFLRFPFDYSRESWSLEDRTYGCNAGFTHWLPHHALPVPTPRKEENLE